MSDNQDPRAHSNINIDKTLEIEPETVAEYDKLSRNEIMDLVKSYTSEDQRTLQEKGFDRILRYTTMEQSEWDFVLPHGYASAACLFIAFFPSVNAYLSTSKRI